MVMLVIMVMELVAINMLVVFFVLLMLVLEVLLLNMTWY